MMTSKSQSSCEKDQIIVWPIIHLFCPGHTVSLHNFMQIKCKLTSNLVLPAIQTIWQMRLILSICRIVSFFHNINYSMLLQVMEFILPTRISSTGFTHTKIWILSTLSRVETGQRWINYWKITTILFTLLPK